MGGKKIQDAAATEEVAAATIPAEAAIAALEEQVASLQAALKKALEDKDALAKEFDQYKADAQEVLAHSAKARIITSDKPVLEYNGSLYVFQTGVVHLNGKKVYAREVAESPASFETEIQQLLALKILKPFKSE